MIESTILKILIKLPKQKIETTKAIRAKKKRVFTALQFIRGRMIDGSGINRLLVPES